MNAGRSAKCALLQGMSAIDPPDLTAAVHRAVYAAAGHLQQLAAEVGAAKIWEADLRGALRAGLQMQLGPRVLTEVPVAMSESWAGKLGAVDVAVLASQDGEKIGFIETKWCRDNKITEALFDLLKMGSCSTLSATRGAFLVYGARDHHWTSGATTSPVELFDEGDVDVAALIQRFPRGWKYILAGSKTVRPKRVPSALQTTDVLTVPIHTHDAEDWTLRCVRVAAKSVEMLDFGEDGWPITVTSSSEERGEKWYPMADLGGEISQERWDEHFTDHDGEVTIIDPATLSGLPSTGRHAAT